MKCGSSWAPTPTKNKMRVVEAAKRGNQPPFEREVAFSQKMAEGAFGSLTHRLFWLPPSPPVGSAHSPLPEGALQSETEPQRDRRPLPTQFRANAVRPYNFNEMREEQAPPLPFLMKYGRLVARKWSGGKGGKKKGRKMVNIIKSYNLGKATEDKIFFENAKKLLNI